MNSLIIFPLLLYSVIDTDIVKIHAEIEGQNVNVVRYHIPNDYFFYESNNSSYKDITGGKIFDFRIPLNTSSFISLDFNREDGILLAVNSGDSISIKVKRTQGSNYPHYEFKIEGSNAEAHNLYLNKFYPAGKNLAFIDDLPHNTNSYSDYFIQSKKYIDSVTSVWDSLKQNNLISKDVYDLYMADTKGCLYDVAIRRMSLVKPIDTSWASYTKWLQLKQVMYYYADAANPIHLKTYVGAHVYQTYLRNILEFDDLVTDTLIKKTDLGFFYYYDTLYREEAWGRTLWEFKLLFPTTASPANLHDADAFAKYYPHSYFYEKVKAFDDSIANERKDLPGKINIDTKEYNSLNDIFNTMDERYFFIDVWATWCGPCIEQFNSYTRLSKFLDEKNISEVYFSVDKNENSEAWQNFIKAQHLAGNHFLISDKIQKELFQILSKDKKEADFFIPRYLLYDKQLDKYYTDLPRPNTGIVLESVINDIVK